MAGSSRTVSVPVAYVETSVVSYLTARPAGDPERAARQRATRLWWRVRHRCGLVASETVLYEARRGDPAAADRRIRALRGIELLPAGNEAESLARHLLAKHALPDRAVVDALHVAIAAVHGVDYLVTWNCRHIANAVRRGDIDRACIEMGYSPPRVCTPLELIEVLHDRG